MKDYRIVLASASPRRQELLSQIGMEFEVVPSRKEEKITEKEPERIVQELSRQKAEDIFRQMTENNGTEQAADDRRMLVIGADTIVSCDAKIMGKPKDREDACRMLKLLQGRSHQVYTGVTVIWQSKESCSEEHFTFYECTQVEFYPMSAAEIEAYAACGEPMDKAGAYGIQGRCAAYIKGIQGDYNNVVGLPVGRLYQELHKRELI